MFIQIPDISIFLILCALDNEHNCNDFSTSSLFYLWTIVKRYIEGVKDIA